MHTNLNTPLVTIAIPTFNRAETLERALSSARRQTHSNLEIIVCDNASSDGTENVCRKHAAEDPRIRYLRHPENIGPERNFAAGLRAARGELFMWLADDDWIDEDYVRACAETLRADEESVIAVGAVRYYHQGACVSTERFQLASDSPSRRILGYFWDLGFNGVYYGLMRRDQIAAVALDEWEGHLPHAEFAGDWFVIAGMLLRGKVRVVGEVALHRAFGESVDLGRLIRRFGLPEIVARYPMTYVSWRAFVLIGWKSPAYSTMPKLPRGLLGLAACAVVATHAPRSRVRGRLRGIARRVGMNQA